VSTTNTGINDDWLPLAIAANQVTVYSNTAATGSTANWATSTPSWLSSAKTKLHYWANTTNNSSNFNRWVIQMKLPLDETGVSGTGVNGLPIGRSGFKLWFSAVHPAFTLSAVTPTAAANFFTWPDDGSTTFAAVSQVDVPARDIANWAPARADGNTAGCAGITLATGDIGTRRGGMDSNQVSVTQPNTLFARPVLHAPSTAPASVPPNTLTATFRFANWGSQALGTYTGSSWTVPLSLNPNPPMDTIGMTAIAGGTATTTIESTWNLTQDERCRFTGKSGVTDALGNFIPGDNACPNQNPIVDLHSCMQVDLNGPGQLFLNQSAFRNMNFVQASEVVRGARISVAGLPDAADGKRDVYMYVQQRNMPAYDSRLKSGSNEKSLIQVTPQQREILSTLARGGSPSGSVDALAGIMPTYMIHVYHDTGKDLTAEDGTKIRLLAPQTSFGYFVAHNGDLQGWQDRLEGAQPVGPPNLYKVAVPNGGEVKVTNRISAIEPPCTCQCNDVSCRLKCNLSVANGGGTLSTSLAFVGALGAGGFAFLRRRRSQKLSDLVERSKN
jgi:MYXO-CTERM domain-containing protein